MNPHKQWRTYEHSGTGSVPTWLWVAVMSICASVAMIDMLNAWPLLMDAWRLAIHLVRGS